MSTKRMTTETIMKCAHEMSQTWLKAAGCGTEVQMNNQIDVLRNAATMFLGVDLANAKKHCNWNNDQVCEHLSGLLNSISHHAKRLEKAIEEGETVYVTPQEFEQ